MQSLPEVKSPEVVRKWRTTYHAELRIVRLPGRGQEQRGKNLDAFVIERCENDAMGEPHWVEEKRLDKPAFENFEYELCELLARKL